MGEHWSDAYIGRPYVVDEFDCAALAAEVAHAHFGQSVTLPQRAAGLRGTSRQIDDLQDDFAEPISEPQEGCPVLMRCRGTLSHVGVYCEIAGEPWVLHAMRNAGHVVRHRVRDLPRVNLEVVGYFKWKT